MSVATGITSAKDRRISPVPVSLVGLPAKAILIQSAGGSRQSVEQDDQHLWWQATISYKHLQTIQQVLVKLQKDRIWIILVKSCETGFRKIEILKLGLFWWGLPKPNFIICQWGSPRHLKKAPQCLAAASGQGVVLGTISPLPQKVAETTVFSVEGIRFHKWQMQTKIIQSYYVFIWVSVCCSDMLIFIFAFKQLSRDITADQGLLMSSTTAPSSKLLLRLKSNVSTFRQVYLGVLQVGQTWHCLDRVVRTVCWAVGDEFYSSVQIGRYGQFDYWKGLFKKKTKKPCISRRKVT